MTPRAPPRFSETPGPPCPFRPTLRFTGNLITFQRKGKLGRVSRSFLGTGGCLHEGKKKTRNPPPPPVRYKDRAQARYAASRAPDLYWHAWLRLITCNQKALSRRRNESRPRSAFSKMAMQHKRQAPGRDIHRHFSQASRLITFSKKAPSKLRKESRPCSARCARV